MCQYKLFFPFIGSIGDLVQNPHKGGSQPPGAVR